jgi:hypothetical protein
MSVCVVSLDACGWGLGAPGQACLTEIAGMHEGARGRVSGLRPRKGSFLATWG